MLVNLLLFILMLFVIVMIHEFGHLVTAKLFGVYCQEFSFGMGPQLFSKKGKETTYSIRAFPIGGFVSMAGDNDNPIEPGVMETLPKERTLNGIHPIKKIIIMYAGIFMNIVLAFVLCAGVMLYQGTYAASPDTTLAAVTENYPAYNAGIRAGDKITSITLMDGSKYSVSTFTELSSYLSMYEGEGSVILTVEKSDGSVKDCEITPILVEQDGESRYVVGIQSNQYNYVEVNFLNCFKYSAIYLATMTRMIFGSLINLVKGIGLSNVSGPVGIYQVTSEAASYGIPTYLNLMAILSLNVGIFNALPLPIMDGGRALITVIEMIIGKPLNEKFVNAIMVASVILLFGLLIFATFQDITKLF